MEPWGPWGLLAQLGPPHYWVAAQLGFVIWYITGTLSVILFSIVNDTTLLRMKFDDSGMKVNDLGTKYIPKKSNIDPKWANTPLGSASRCQGVYLWSQRFLLNHCGVVSHTNFVKCRTTIVKLRTNSLQTANSMTDKVPAIFPVKILNYATNR